MPINFVDGSRMTLRESMTFIGRGSRTPHPGWENTMTTLLAQLGVPIELCWEVRADLKGYRVTHVDGRRISHDDAKCGPWAEFDTDRWNRVLSAQPAKVRQLLARCKTPFQVHMALAKAAFPHVETSASFYLRHRGIVQQVLEVIAHSRFREHFAKFVDESGGMHQIYQAYGNRVYYHGNRQVTESELAEGYLRLLEFVEQSEVPGTRIAFPTWGVLPDARILCLLDMVIYALNATTDSVCAWSGISMMQYILKEADSQRWREIVSGMYDLVRQRALPALPRVLDFTLIPTLGLGDLAVTDASMAQAVNTQLRQLNVAGVREERTDKVALQQMARDDAHAFLAHIALSLEPNACTEIAQMLDDGNWQGAGGKASALISLRSKKQHVCDRHVVEAELGELLRDNTGRFVLTNQPAVDALAYANGTRLHLLEGVLDIPAGKLDSYRARLANIASRGQRKNTLQDDGPLLPYFNRAGWMLE